MAGVKLKKKKPAPEYEHASTLPVSEAVLRMLAQEMPFHPADERRFIMQTLENWDGPVIETQADLPASIRELMDLD